MKLKELYKHRTDFTIIGLTGRTGSGCTRIADLLTNDFDNLKREGLKTDKEKDSIDDIIFKRKYEITYNYFDKTNNWTKFDLIKYRDVLIFILFNKCGDNYASYSKLFDKYYSFEKLKRVNKEKLLLEIKEFVLTNSEILKNVNRQQKVD